MNLLKFLLSNLQDSPRGLVEVHDFRKAGLETQWKCYIYKQKKIYVELIWKEAG
jgi:hypothetical protein